jgi:hypothetical protein
MNRYWFKVEFGAINVIAVYAETRNEAIEAITKQTEGLLLTIISDT